MTKILSRWKQKQQLWQKPQLQIGSWDKESWYKHRTENYGASWCQASKWLWKTSWEGKSPSLPVPKWNMTKNCEFHGRTTVINHWIPWVRTKSIYHVPLGSIYSIDLMHQECNQQTCNGLGEHLQYCCNSGSSNSAVKSRRPISAAGAGRPVGKESVFTSYPVLWSQRETALTVVMDTSMFTHVLIHNFQDQWGFAEYIVILLPASENHLWLLILPYHSACHNYALIHIVTMALCSDSTNLYGEASLTPGTLTTVT